MLTAAHAIVARDIASEPPSRRMATYSREAAAAGSNRCALYHARFGGRRAQLIRVMQGSVWNYVIIEVGKTDPSQMYMFL